MKTIYHLFCVVALIAEASTTTRAAEEPHADPLSVVSLSTIPEGRYSVTLELKQLDGIAAPIMIEALDGKLVTVGENRLGKIEGSYELIGNSVFMVRLQGRDYRATQFWIFHADGSANIKEIPDRGEKQRVVPVPKEG